MISNGNNSSNETHDNRELNRRNAVSKSKIFTKIFFNGKEVCQSMSKPLTSDFVVQVGQIFPLQIVQLPELLTLQIIEGGTIKTTVLAEIKLPLCEPTKVQNIWFFSPLVSSKRGKDILSLSQFVYFLREVCVYFLIFE